MVKQFFAGMVPGFIMAVFSIAFVALIHILSTAHMGAVFFLIWGAWSIHYGSRIREARGEDDGRSKRSTYSR